MDAVVVAVLQRRLQLLALEAAAALRLLLPRQPLLQLPDAAAVFHLRR